MTYSMVNTDIDSAYDGPQPNNNEPQWRDRGQGNRETDRGRNDVQRREVELGA